MKKDDKSLLRILDANFNRAKEGLRVCEDICRYSWDEKQLTRLFKEVRHDLTQVAQALNLMKVLQARQVASDVGSATSLSEAKRQDVAGVFWANSQRVKESIRVLEEIIKIIDPKVAQQMKELRYRVYVIEQKVVSR